ncbi:MAG TPA: flagellar basal body P-ring protein FlgI [Terriglobales bacterium]|jgi:flagellar P-ring protein precursor FlgI
MKTLVVLLCFTLLAGRCVGAADENQVLIRDVVTVEGVRENPLIGYGIVVGLKGTGDSRQTIFTVQTLANVLQRMGVQIPPASARVNNVAAVFVTANLPVFARPGTQIDITVSSVGDAKSLEGGMLLLTPLTGADGQIYAAAQGPLTIGGYTTGGSGNGKQVNHPTVGRIPAGGLVERAIAMDLRALPRLSLLLREPSFTAASEIALAVNHEFGKTVAAASDGRRIEIDTAATGTTSLVALMTRVENLAVRFPRRAKVVVNERTGTVVMGKDVRLRAVSILHGALSIEIATELNVSQPNPLAKGDTVVVPQQAVRSEDTTAKRVELTEGASVEQLVGGLQSIGATARDVIAILQAIKAAGALEADLEVI